MLYNQRMLRIDCAQSATNNYGGQQMVVVGMTTAKLEASFVLVASVDMVNYERFVDYMRPDGL
jgi:hypothetical protein